MTCRGLAVAVMILSAGCAEAAESGKLRALIFSGRNNHDWRTTTPFLKKVLTWSGRFDVRVTEEPEGTTGRTLASYDVLVLDYVGARWGEETERAVERFVSGGKGLVAVHAASYPFGDCPILGDNMTNTGRTEPPWMEYRKMIGAYWSRSDQPHTGHGLQHTFQVKFVDREHPISKGMGEYFLATDELYHNFRMMPGVKMLATAYDDPKMNGTGKDEPSLWTLSYGKGRVFHTALGHSVAAMQSPGFITTLARGAEWAATGAVTLPAQVGPPQPTTRLLVITGGHGYDTSFYTLFEGYDDLRWDHVAGSGAAFRKDVRERYDAVLFYNMEQELGAEERKNLQAFVEGGKGVIVLHHAIANYNDWPWWYEQVVGGKYLLKGEAGRPASTYQHDLDLRARAAGRHPIIGGASPLYIRDELYKGMWISKDVKVLMTTDHPAGDGPLVWVSPYAKSRVTAILLGHDRAAHEHAGFRALVRNAIVWAAGK